MNILQTIWQLAGGCQKMAGGMWPNCLGAVREAGIKCPHQMAVRGKKPDIVAGAGVLSTFYVLMLKAYEIKQYQISFEANCLV